MNIAAVVAAHERWHRERMRLSLQIRIECRKCKRDRADAELGAKRALSLDGETFVEALSPCPQCGTATIRLAVDIDIGG